MRLTILYRGPLSSCNYDCYYCPFAKQVDSPAELKWDRDCLEKFVSWCQTTDFDSLNIFFTPWGEALTRRWYWTAFERLTSVASVGKVAVQTNLSGSLSWLDCCDYSKVGIWATYHPSQVNREKFLGQVEWLHARGISHSVGMVGIREDFEAIAEMRLRLPTTTYLWINAYKSQVDYYTSPEIDWLIAIDPLFGFNHTHHPSLHSECNTGESVISVDGLGDIRRCHFVKRIIGNLYRDDLASVLRPRLCPNASCGCHIGYVHMPQLKLQQIFLHGLLERVPAAQACQDRHTIETRT